MKFILYCFIFLFVVSLSYSQPTLTSSLIPQIGEKYSYTNIDTTGLKSGNTGANVSWDFSGIKKLTGPDDVINFEIVAPSSGFQSQFFTAATYAYKQDSAYSYYKVVGSEVQRLGTGFAEGHELLTNLQTNYKFPFTYQDNFSDDFAGSMLVNVDGTDYELTRTGSIKCTADGYGTIILPTGTFSNVLRLKVEQNITDSMPPPIPGFPGMTIKTTAISYVWVNASFKFSLFEYSNVKTITNAMGNVSTAYANSAHLYDTKPSGSGTLSTPSSLLPTDGAIVTLPVDLQWAPSTLTGTTKGNNEITATVTYEVEISTKSDFSSIAYSTETTNTSTTVTNLTGASKFYWRVRSYSGATFSQWSATNSFSIKSTKPGTPVLNIPANNATNISTTGSFGWSADASIIKWRLQLAKDNAFTNIALTTNPTSNNFTLTSNEKLSNNTNYWWRVKGFTATDSSDWSPVWAFTTTDNSSVTNIINDDNSLQILPNPVNNFANINLNVKTDGNSIAKIYNMNGELMITQNISGQQIESNSIRIDMTSLANGVYIIAMETGSKIYMRTFIKK